jgi:hypothetical protein
MVDFSCRICENNEPQVMEHLEPMPIEAVAVESTSGSSGNFIIGDVMVQWGSVTSTVDGPEAVLFGVPFGGTAHNVTFSLEYSDVNSYGGRIVSGTVSDTGFSFNRHDGIENSMNPILYWQAIGPRPTS